MINALRPASAWTVVHDSAVLVALARRQPVK
jgi:hypothetical protein